MKMFRKIILFVFIEIAYTQVLQFGKCADVKTMEYFQIDKFLGKWYVIEQYPVWYEKNSNCAFKVFGLCGRSMKIQSGFVENNMQFILHMNSTYNSGDEAVFKIERNNIDPVGVPLSVISTDYTNYSLLYGCRLNENLQLKYIAVWILSRNTTLSQDLMDKAYYDLYTVPDASPAYLQRVKHDEELCTYKWTADIHAVNITDT